MILDIKLDIKNNSAEILEQLDYGAEKIKTVDLDEFLQNYTSYIKEKEDKYDFLYLPPGTIEYKKNFNSITFMVETQAYKTFYGVGDYEHDFFLVMQTDLDIKKVISYKLYKTNGPFNRHFSVFSEVAKSVEPFDIKNEEQGIKTCIEEGIKNAIALPKVNLRYKNIA